MTKPEMKFRAGGCSASVFVNEFETPAGKKRARNVVLERAYKDSNGDFQTSKSLSLNDVPRAILVLRKAYEHMATQPLPAEPSLVRKEHQDLSTEPSP